MSVQIRESAEYIHLNKFKIDLEPEELERAFNYELS